MGTVATSRVTSMPRQSPDNEVLDAKWCSSRLGLRRRPIGTVATNNKGQVAPPCRSRRGW